MDSFLRSKRAGETREEYACAMQELVAQSLAREFPETSHSSKPARKPSLIDAPTATQPKPKPAETKTTEATQQKTASCYKKTGGAADGAGENYEWKMLTLVFLRMLAAGHEFQLASNMEAAGLFDDIVVRYRKHSKDPWRVACLQLKHKQNKHKVIKKSALLGFSGDFSLIKYCASYASAEFGREGQFIIFTNASVDVNLVDVLECDTFLNTEGKVVSFKAGGEVYRELCEWADFKETLDELYSQVDGLSGEKVRIRIKDALKSVKYQNKAVASYKQELVKFPNLGHLHDLRKKLEPVSDKDTCASFLANLQAYTNQVHESELDGRIKEALAQVWVNSKMLEAEIMLQNLKDTIKSWWQKDNVYLSQDSPLWFGIIKSQTETFSKKTTDDLSKSGAEFVESSLQVLHHAIPSRGIVNVRVDSRTAASSLKVHHALAKFGVDENVLHVNVKALLDREVDVFSAWATRWCRVLVVECDTDIEQKHASRIRAKIIKTVGRKDENKLLVLIAAEKHDLNVQLHREESYKRFNDNCEWRDLTDKTKENILSMSIVLNGSRLPLTLSELLAGETSFVNKADLEVISQFLSQDFLCGNALEDEDKFFVTRRLTGSANGVPFVLNSVSDIRRKVVLVVAEPGMGKSTLITYLAKSAKAEDPTAWIVHIKLNDCAQYLNEMDMEHFNEAAAVKFLEQSALSPGNYLEKLLFVALGHKLVIFVDGVDEVCPHYEQHVFKLLSCIKEMNFRQFWVASRPAFQRKLEIKLEVRALRMVAFSERDQTEFFNKIWLAKDASATPEECNKITESLLTWLTDSLGKDNPILGVPLMTAMIAETFQEDNMFSVLGASGDFKKNKRLDVMHLYKTFVEKKFNIYCVEKKNTLRRELAANKNDEDILLKNINHNHRIAALSVLFNRKEIAGLQFEGKEMFEEDLTTYLKEVSDGREKTGIIDNVIGGIPHFVHRSFAEFFAAEWLALNFATNGEFIERIIFEPACTLLNEMFNRSLADNHPLHIAVLNRDLNATSSILNSQPKVSHVNDLDAGGRTPLHLAVILSATDPHPDCIRIVEYLVQDYKARIDVADDVLGWEALRYAERSRVWSALHIMLKKFRSAKKNNLNLFPKQKGWPKPCSCLMLAAARDASALVVRYLSKERRGKLDCRGPLGETMAHTAAEGGNVELLEYLNTKGTFLGIKDKENNTAMHYASPQAIHYLANSGLNLNAVNKQGLTALQVAAQNGEYEKMAVLLKVNASVQISALTTEAQLNASLLSAAFANKFKYLQTLLELGASLDHRDKNGHTAAWVAMQRRHIDVMEWLLLRSSKEGDTPLHGACRKGEIEIVRFILMHRTDIDAKGWHGQTPIFSAADAGHLNIVKLLLEKGASMDCRDKYGRTPLHTALLQDQESVAPLQLRRGAGKLFEDDRGRTPMNFTTVASRLDVMTLLMEKGANADYRDEYGWTPLHLSSSHGHGHIVALLLRHGSDIEVGNNRDEKPLHSACKSNHSGVVKLLLENGANVNCCDKDGRTPLYTASLHGHINLIELLLGHGAVVDAEDNEGMTPLNSACKRNNSKMVTLLLKKGANVNFRDKDGRTPLFTASLHGNKRIVELLLEHGADIDAEDNKGTTPRLAASKRFHLNTVKLLLEKRANMMSRDYVDRRPI